MTIPNTLSKPVGRFLRVRAPGEIGDDVYVVGVDLGGPTYLVGRFGDVVVTKGGNPVKFMVWRIVTDHGLLLDCEPLIEFKPQRPHSK